MFPTSRMLRRRALISSASAVIFAGTLSQYASGQTADSSSTQHPKARVDPGLTYQMQTDPSHQVTLPHLTQFPDSAVLKSVNTDLNRQQHELLADAQRCISIHRPLASWEQTSRVAVLTRDVLSIDILVSYYCGGPHPDEQYFPLTYNLRTGRQFDFDRDAAKIFKADRLPSDQLIGLYKQAYPPDSGECNPSLIEPGTKLFLHLESTGLSITPEMPHVAAACGPEIVIPYQQLRTLLKDGNPFQKLVGP